jgi:hypothetical protein
VRDIEPDPRLLPSRGAQIHLRPHH